MPSHQYYCRFQWGPRPQSLSEIVKYLNSTLEFLGQNAQAGIRWTLPNGELVDSGSRKRCTQLHYYLQNSVNDQCSNDEGDAREIGYQVSFWEVGSRDRSPIQLTCALGATSEWVPNVVSLSIPLSNPLYEVMFSNDAALVARHYSKHVIQTWNPNCGCISTYEIASSIGFPDFTEEVGWLTCRRGKPSSQLVRLAQKGKLYCEIINGHYYVYLLPVITPTPTLPEIERLKELIVLLKT